MLLRNKEKVILKINENGEYESNISAVSLILLFRYSVHSFMVMPFIKLLLFNSFMTEVLIIKKPVQLFAEQINGLVSI